MEVVRQVKRLTHQRHVGHGGTLDPMASGTLPICFGQATRVMDFLVEGTKVYQAQVALGVTTDTYDAVGKVVAQSDPSGITREQVEGALASFRGLIYQTPPMFSALKREGQRLYELARAGVEVPRSPRPVRVLRLDLLAWEPPVATLEVECGRGVYVRSLAHDLGAALGCGAHLAALCRLRAGPFAATTAITLEVLAQAVQAGDWQELLHCPDVALLHYQAAIIGPVAARAVRQGRHVFLGYRPGPPPLHRDACRLYSTEGAFLAIARYNSTHNLWHPDRVFTLPLLKTS